MFQTPLPEDGPPPKSHMLLLRSDGQSTFVGLDRLIEIADESGEAVVQHGDRSVQLIVTEYHPARLTAEDAASIDSMRILWISGRAISPESVLATPEQP